MITMSTIWDRTTEVIRGRGAMLATIAGALSFLPNVAQNALLSFGIGRSPALVPLAGLIVILVGILSLWSNLSLVAATSDPAITDVGQAVTVGGRRLPLMVGAMLLIVIALFVIALPAFGILGAGMVNMAAARAHPGNVLAALSAPSPGTIAGFSLYMLALSALAFWLSARLFVFVPVIVNERLGLGSFARSFELTRGLTWRIIGVQILFGIVFVIALFATQAVVGVIARLLLGPERMAMAAFVARIATAALTASYVVLVATFSAQLYRAVSGVEAARAFA